MREELRKRSSIATGHRGPHSFTPHYGPVRFVSKKILFGPRFDPASRLAQHRVLAPLQYILEQPVTVTCTTNAVINVPLPFTSNGVDHDGTERLVPVER